MKPVRKFPIFRVAAGFVGVLAVLAWLFPGAGSGNSTVDVKVPQLSAVARAGARAFDDNCAACLGNNASGTKQGPPLIHGIYNPGHHADDAFRYAVRQGVRQHHWTYGDMPPLPAVTDSQVAQIIRYVRELQDANGIVYRAHRM